MNMVTFEDEWQVMDEANLRKALGEVGMECTRLYKVVDGQPAEVAA